MFPLACLQPSYALTLELSESDRNFDDKADILEQGGMPLASEFLLRADEAPDDQMLPVLRLLNLQGGLTVAVKERAFDDWAARAAAANAEWCRHG